MTPEERQRHNQLRAVARVRLVLECHSGPWDGSARFSDLHALAQREAIEKLPTALLRRGYRVVGPVLVVGVELRPWVDEQSPEESR